MTMRDMTDAELAAVAGLQEGSVGPLASILADEDRGLHPLVMRALARAVSGTAKQSDWRLTMVAHPDLTDQRNSNRSKLAKQADQLAIAVTYAAHGGLIYGKGKNALDAARDKHGVKRTAITDAWSRNKLRIALSIRDGHITVPDQARPSDAQLKRIIRIALQSARRPDLHGQE